MKWHISLAVKVNILIIAVIITVSLLLMLSSERAFRTAVFEPYEEKLADVTMPEGCEDYLEFFSGFMGSEELREVRAGIGTDDDRYVDWLKSQPAMNPAVVEGNTMSLLYDVLSFSVIVDAVREEYDMDSVIAEIDKDGKVYRVFNSEKGSFLTNGYYQFGLEEGFRDLRAEDFAKPVMSVKNDIYDMVRCVEMPLKSGMARFWLIYYMTDTVQEHNGFVTRTILFLVGITVVLSAATVLLLRRYVTRPVRKLAKAATEFVPGEDGTYSADKISKVEIRTRDEIGALSHEIISMQTRIVENTDNLTRMTKEKERINTELNMATRIQEDSLPHVFPPFPDRKEFDLYAFMRPAREVGGDFYDFFFIDDDHLALEIADVSGKGIPGALFMMVAKAVLKNNAKLGGSPAETLAITNDTICSSNKAGMFVSVWLGILEISTGKITAVNAGHEYPVLYRKETGKYEMFKDPHGFVVGGMAGLRYREYTLTLKPGDRVFVYTDGVPEATDPQNQLFGTERMISALNRNTFADPEDTLRGVEREVNRFVGGAEQFDDMTMLYLEYKGTEKA